MALSSSFVHLGMRPFRRDFVLIYPYFFFSSKFVPFHLFYSLPTTIPTAYPVSLVNQRRASVISVYLFIVFAHLDLAFYNVTQKSKEDVVSRRMGFIK